MNYPLRLAKKLLSRLNQVSGLPARLHDAGVKKDMPPEIARAAIF